MGFIEQFFVLALSEFGVLVGFLLLVIVGLVLVIRVLWKRGEKLVERLLTIVENNTRVMTQLVDKLEEKDD